MANQQDDDKCPNTQPRDRRNLYDESVLPWVGRAVRWAFEIGTHVPSVAAGCRLGGWDIAEAAVRAMDVWWGVPWGRRMGWRPSLIGSVGLAWLWWLLQRRLAWILRRILLSLTVHSTMTWLSKVFAVRTPHVWLLPLIALTMGSTAVGWVAAATASHRIWNSHLAKPALDGVRARADARS